MELLELIRQRRSIRKYQNRQIPEDALDSILEAGSFAPNAGGGQRRMAVAIYNRDLAEMIGRMNAGKMDRSRLAGSYVSKDQPSLIDDPSIRSGFYGAPTVVAVFAQKNFLYSIPDAFCMAENMVIMAQSLGISSCIVARGEETFDSEAGRQILQEWEIPDDYIARCFVLLGYCEGEYPREKPRREGKTKVIR